jgi:hypothetical protein
LPTVLAFDDRQLLPRGIHDASLEEVEEALGRFQRSDRRPTLFRKLCDYLTALRTSNCGDSVIVNGSFVMRCVDEPDDIDLIVVLPRAWDTSADLKPYQYNLLSRRRMKKDVGFDVFPVVPGSPQEQEWVSFFSAVSPKWLIEFGWASGAEKGLVRVKT